MIEPLSTKFQPRSVNVQLTCASQLVSDVQNELTAKAKTDKNKCWGYFPAMKDKASIDTKLPISRRFAQSVPELRVNEFDMNFNFVRLSLVKQTGDSPFHLDTDAATALTGNAATLSKRLVWRLLINLSDKHPRTLSYLDIDSSKITLVDDDGYVHCDKKLVTKDVIRRIAVAPRRDNHVSGVLFCASRVLHTGQDDKFGHFVSGYGYEELDKS